MKPTPYASLVTVPLPTDAQARAVMGSSYDPGQALNVMKMFAGTGDFYPALVGMVRAVFGAQDIDARHREVIVLRAASVLNVPYEWQANEKMARNAGLSAGEVAAIADKDMSGLPEEDVLMCTAVDETLATASLSDATLQAFLSRFGEVLTRRYIVTIGWFALLSFFLNSTRVPLETTDKIGNRTTPLS